MTEPLLSVRGDASRLVDPDYAVLTGHLRIIRSSKAESLADAAAAQTALTSDLATLGGVTATRHTSRSPLTWSVPSVTTEIETAHNAETGNWEETGRVTAVVWLTVVVRDFTLLEELGSTLARHSAVEVQRVSWEVDDDNAAWPEVRAEAIHAAIAKGRDYAAALGSALLGVNHIADTGLLSTGGSSGGNRGRAGGMTFAARSASGAPDSPSLDPVPQDVTATIEARFTATAVPPSALG